MKEKSIKFNKCLAQTVLLAAFIGDSTSSLDIAEGMARRFAEILEHIYEVKEESDK